jgi:hypothetical protein
MTPRPHRRRSSKESRARRCDVLDLVGPRSLMRLLVCFAPRRPPADFPIHDRCFAYGYPSRHSDGTAIGR